MTTPTTQPESTAVKEEAVEVLAKVMRDHSASHANRVSAARSLLEYSSRLKELDLEERVAALEGWLNAGGGR